MKWRYLLVFAVLLSGLLPACSSPNADPGEKAEADQTVMNSLDDEQQTGDSQANEGEAEIVPEPGEAGSRNYNFPASAYEGRIDGIPYGLGDLTEGMQDELNDPDSIQYFAGGLYFSYPQVVYFTDAKMDEDGKVIDGTVRRMGFRENTPIMGVVVGQTFEEIANVLGEDFALRTPEENVNNEFYESAWSIEYTIGDEYALVFTAEERDGPTQAAYFEEL